MLSNFLSRWKLLRIVDSMGKFSVKWEDCSRGSNWGHVAPDFKYYGHGDWLSFIFWIDSTQNTSNLIFINRTLTINNIISLLLKIKHNDAASPDTDKPNCKFGIQFTATEIYSIIFAMQKIRTIQLVMQNVWKALHLFFSLIQSSIFKSYEP